MIWGFNFSAKQQFNDNFITMEILEQNIKDYWGSFPAQWRINTSRLRRFDYAESRGGDLTIDLNERQYFFIYLSI